MADPQSHWYMQENIHDNSAYHCPKSETTEKSIERSKANEIQDF